MKGVWIALALALGGAVLPAQRQPAEIELARDGDTRAWVEPGTGLVVAPWRAAPDHRLVLPLGAWPRFAADGTLYFERSVDDGERVLSSQLMAVDPGSARPRPVLGARVVPDYVAPVVLAASAKTKVCVDAGHGGSDPGAQGFGLNEADTNLDVALALERWLQRDSADTGGGGDWDVLLTRRDDTFVSLGQRANLANAFGAQGFVSIHMNSFSSSAANGTETFCMLGQEANAGGRLRDALQSEALAAWQLTNRGSKSANFAVLRQTSMPAALVEGGFITSPIDIIPIRSSQRRDDLARHCLFGVQAFFGFGRYRPGTGPATGTLRGLVYNAALGSGAGIGTAQVALSDGRFLPVDPVSGYFEWSLPAGSYTFAASAPGYAPRWQSRSVPAGGEVWGSLPLTVANVPELSIDPFPLAGQSMTLTARGDPGALVVLLVNTKPGLPLLRIGALGSLWPTPAGLVSAPIGNIGFLSGTLVTSFTAPAVPGAILHAQVLVQRSQRLRLSNGVGSEIR